MASSSESNVKPGKAMSAVLLKSFGSPEQMYVGEQPTPTITAVEVLIKVHATAVNRADTLQRKGGYPAPEGASPIMGLECAGEIVAVGDQCKRGFKLGQRVMALLSGGGYAQFAAVPESHVMAVPEQLSYIHAAAIPETWLTAFQLLHTIARVRAHEYVLVHAGGSGVGTALIQLVLAARAYPIVTVGDAAKAAFCTKLGAVAAFNYKQSGGFAESVTAFIKQHDQERKRDKDEDDDSKSAKTGVQVVLDCVGGASHFPQNIKVLQLDGRYVLYGLMGGREVEKFALSDVLAKRIALTGTTLRTRSAAYKTTLVSDFAAKSLPGFSGANPVFRPIIDEPIVKGLANMSDAHTRMEANTNIGKIVVTVV